MSLDLLLVLSQNRYCRGPVLDSDIILKINLSPRVGNRSGGKLIFQEFFSFYLLVLNRFLLLQRLSVNFFLNNMFGFQASYRTSAIYLLPFEKYLLFLQAFLLFLTHSFIFAPASSNLSSR